MIELPPLHLRCRCVIIYREIEGSVLRSAPNNGKINGIESSPVKVENATEKLPDGEYNLTIRRQVQNRHIEGTKEYQQYVERLSATGFKPSKIFVDVNVNEVITKFHGKGIYDPNPKDNSPREIVDTGQIIGQYWNIEEKGYIDTSFVEIVYSKKGIHIYPVRPR